MYIPKGQGRKKLNNGGDRGTKCPWITVSAVSSNCAV